MHDIYDAVDLFAGPGGWDLGARELGLEVLGIELDPATCQTRLAAGLATLEADVRACDPFEHLTPGLIASPPCQTFSSAGKGSGRSEMDVVLEALRDWSWKGDFADERTGLVLEPLRWILGRYSAFNPYAWIAFEQVPACLPIWQGYAEILRELGYSAVTGLLNAEQYGVPQTRRRAVLVARLDGEATLPTPTHSRYHSRDPQRLDPDVLPWVSMATALGWPDDWEAVSNYGTGGDPKNRGRRQGWQPSATVTSKIDRTKIYLRSNTSAKAGVRELHEPAPTVYFGERINTAVWINAGEDPKTAVKVPFQADDPQATRRLEVAEAGVLQTFPADFTWRGTRSDRYGQVGNAIPPCLARAILDRAWPSSPHYRTSTMPRATMRSAAHPAPTIAFGNDMASAGWVMNPAGATSTMVSGRTAKFPAGTITGTASAAWAQGKRHMERVTIEQSAVLQTFPAQHPWRGTQTQQYRQIGNAIPPRLARAVLAELTAKAERPWPCLRPATTVQGDPRIWPPGHKINALDRSRLGDEADRRYGDRAGTNAIRVTAEQAAALQSFPPGYPWQGNKGERYQQIGNAIPPPLARAVLAVLEGQR